MEGPRGRVGVNLAHVGAGVVDGDAADGEDEHVAALVVDHADPLVRRHPRRPGRQELCFEKCRLGDLHIQKLRDESPCRCRTST